MRCVAALLAALAAMAAADEDPTEILMRVRDQVVEHGERIPNYTCVETVVRERFQPAGGRATKACDALLARRRQENFLASLKLTLTDRLRLDVALADGHEIYSWAGAAKFEEGEIDEIVPEGAMGTGPFATMLLGVLGQRSPRFFFDGETTVRGQRLFQYSFAVPREQSYYRVKANREWLITGYTGMLLVDPRQAALARFTVRTDELPPETNVCETDSTLDYAMVELRGAQYMLPKVTRQRFIGRDGSESENTLTFSACREYQAASTVSFGEKPVPAEQRKTAEPPWGTGLNVAVELTHAVALDHAAAGDRVEGRLTAPMRDAAAKKTVVPAGALLQGRLMRVEMRPSLPIEITVALRWETIELDGAAVPIALAPERKTGGLKVSGLGGLLQRGVPIDLPLPGEGRYLVTRFKGEHAEMPAGFRSDWLTAKP